jgi:SAM-dependent methyltransferase
VLEIGCNDGRLLRYLRDDGQKEVFGYEPAAVLRQACVNENLLVTGSFFSLDTVAECPITPVDAILVRHVLEHVDDLPLFLRGIVAALRGGGGLLILEVPDVASMLKTPTDLIAVNGNSYGVAGTDSIVQITWSDAVLSGTTATSPTFIAALKQGGCAIILTHGSSSLLMHLPLISAILKMKQ